ncbi:MAG: tRNA glutamyl-Q(34) synthetase GluQRS [Salinarimonadaceae bacterium]|nr:MAG: tRNA glutamyl-Q(34) synthetase GluQRS [Salinarimonadaceae bacterium]
MTQPVFRFAPSPNGRLHLGHAASALLNEELARRSGGRLLLRIEDIDVTRCRPEYEAAIIDDLAWLGIAFEPHIRRQSRHFDEYRAAADRLAAMGLLYPCFRTRREIAQGAAAFEAATGAPAPRDPDGAILRSRALHGHDEAEAARRMAAGEPHALRLDMARARALASESLAYTRFDAAGREETVMADPARWGDAVIVRKEIPTSYHLSVVHDDALQGVTHVVRGVDLEAATDLHVLLQRLLDLPTPRYLHHPLIFDDSGEKLAKSRGSTPLAELRAAGADAQEARRLARLAG